MRDMKDLLEQEVFPALWKRLDSAFPAFEFRLSRNSRYWHATNEQAARQLPGSPRPGRVMAYGDTPFGFTIQGDQFIPWIVYLSGEPSPRGVRFIEIVKDLCQRSGVAFPEQEPQGVKSRREVILEEVLAFCEKTLWRKEGERAVVYLRITRKLSADHIKSFRLGLFPSIEIVWTELRKMFSKEDIREAGLCGDSRWDGRVIGAWRNRSGRILTLWSRNIQGRSDPKSKYLMLPGGGKEAPFGIHSISGNEGILVEGIFDALTLQANGHPAMAIGGLEISGRQIEALNALSLKALTVNFDYDGRHGRGWGGTLKAVLMLSGGLATVYVIDPEVMADPDHPGMKVDAEVMVNKKGAEAYRKLVEGKIHGFRYLAQRHVQACRDLGQTDTAVRDLMDQAVTFERKHPEKLLEVYLYYWRELAFQLGLDWQDLKGLLLRSRASVSQGSLASLSV